MNSNITSDNIDDLLNNIDTETDTLMTDINKEFKKQDNIEIKTKKDLSNHLQCKLDKLGNRLKILQIKYMDYKSYYDKFNIMIILISSILSIFEAFRNEIKEEIENNNSLEIIFSMIPILISSIITCSAAIVKFKKYQDKMENMQFTREKVILSVSKIKHIQEILLFSKDDEFISIKKKYLDDIYSFYNESSSELERHIKHSDHNKLNKLS